MDKEGGYVKVKETLLAFKTMSIKKGAELRYNCEVKSINHEKK